MPSKIYDWAPRARRYRDPNTGRFVSRHTVRRGVDELITDSQAKITDISEALRTGRMTLGDWQRGMQEEIRRTQLGAQALLRGGWAQLDTAAYNAIEARIREQYDFLHAFTEQLRNGEIITDGSFMTRARLYAGASRVGYHEDETELQREVGYREQLNVLSLSEHCVDCVYIARLGWVRIGSVPPIGGRKCLGNDKCHWIYR